MLLPWNFSMMKDIVGTSSKLHNPTKIARDTTKSKNLTIRDSVKLHSFLRARQYDSHLLRSSAAKSSSKKPTWSTWRGKEENTTKGVEVGSTEKKSCDLEYLRELAVTARKFASGNKETHQFSSLPLTKPYQYSFFAKYTWTSDVMHDIYTFHAIQQWYMFASLHACICMPCSNCCN